MYFSAIFSDFTAILWFFGNKIGQCRYLGDQSGMKLMYYALICVYFLLKGKKTLKLINFIH